MRWSPEIACSKVCGGSPPHGWRCAVQSYSMMEGGEDISENIRQERITHYVEHPVPIEPPIEESPAAPMPLMLTTKVSPHPSTALLCRMQSPTSK